MISVQKFHSFLLPNLSKFSLKSIREVYSVLHKSFYLIPMKIENLKCLTL